jgi:hypothetical protein
MKGGSVKPSRSFGESCDIMILREENRERMHLNGTGILLNPSAG